MNDNSVLTSDNGYYIKITKDELIDLVNSLVLQRLQDGYTDINVNSIQTKSITNNGTFVCNGRINVYPDPVQNYGGGEIILYPRVASSPSMHIDNTSTSYRIWSRPAGYTNTNNNGKDFTTVEWRNDTWYNPTYTETVKHDITPKP